MSDLGPESPVGCQANLQYQFNDDATHLADKTVETFKNAATLFISLAQGHTELTSKPPFYLAGRKPDVVEIDAPVVRLDQTQEVIIEHPLNPGWYSQKVARLGAVLSLSFSTDETSSNSYKVAASVDAAIKKQNSAAFPPIIEIAVGYYAILRYPDESTKAPVKDPLCLTRSALCSDGFQVARSILPAMRIDSITGERLPVCTISFPGEAYTYDGGRLNRRDNHGQMLDHQNLSAPDLTCLDYRLDAVAKAVSQIDDASKHLSGVNGQNRQQYLPL